MSSIFHIGASIYPFFKQENGGYTKHADEYQVIKFTKFNLDGSLEGDYKKITDNSVFNAPRKSLIIHCRKPPADLKELKIRVNALLDSADEYLAEYAAARNNEIDKQNKKLDKQNTILNVKNNFIKVRIFIDFAIIAVLVLLTLALLFSDGIAEAIGMGIFLDSWIIYLCVEKIEDHKEDLRDNNISKSLNNSEKKEHI